MSQDILNISHSYGIIGLSELVMGKFKINLEIQGLKLSIEGDKDDVGQMTQAVGQQMAGLLGPTSQIVEGEVVEQNTNAPALNSAPPAPNKPRKKRATSPKPSASSATTKTPTAIDWVHDSSKWGVPSQEWVTSEKAMWLLYVVKQEKQLDELDARTIEATFNKHFKQSGTIVTGNINRDLGRLKVGKPKKPALLSENTTVDPSAWFLTQEGEKNAQGLVVKALGLFGASG